VIGCEADCLTLERPEKLNSFLASKRGVAIAPATMRQRIHISAAEIDLIRAGANVADVGGHAIKAAVKVDAREMDVAMAGPEAMAAEIAAGARRVLFRGRLQGE